jgi:xanthine dehydrogenase YagS FAD-binding subunit
MKAFDFSRPASFEEVASLLGSDQQDGNGQVRFLAGGTDLLTLMKADLVTPVQLIDLKHLPELNGGIAEVDDGLRLGALTTLAEIERHPFIRQRYPVLAEAAGLAATPQLRNMATIGGNLLQRPRCWYFRNQNFQCWLKGGADCPALDGENQLHAIFDRSPCVAVFPSDLASALLALNAELRLRGPGGERIIPINDLYTLPTEEHRTETALGHDELVLGLRLPPAAAGLRSTYLKAMDRKIWAFALVGVAAAARLDGGRIAEARLVLSGVAPIPWRVEAAEQVLIGSQPGAALFEQAAEAALTEATPLGQNGYKVPLAHSLIRRALAAITDGAGG